MTLDLNPSTIGVIFTFIGMIIGFFKTFSKMQHTNESQNEEIKTLKTDITFIKQEIKNSVNIATFEKILKELKEEISKVESKIDNKNDETLKQIMGLTGQISEISGILKQKFQ